LEQWKKMTFYIIPLVMVYQNLSVGNRKVAGYCDFPVNFSILFKPIVWEQLRLSGYCDLIIGILRICSLKFLPLQKLG